MVRLGGTRRVLAALLALAGIATTALVEPPSHAATPATGTVSSAAPLSWDFAGVGGPNGDTDTFKLTVQLPAPEATFYAPDARVGSTHAAVLTITQTWTGTAPDQNLTLAATDPQNNSVGNATFGTVNDGSDISVLTLQNPRNATYTITAENFLGNSTADMPSHAVATLAVKDLAGQAQPAPPAGAPAFVNYHLPLDKMPPTQWEQQVVGGRAFGEPSIGVDPRNDSVMYQAGAYTMKATFDQANPPVATWTDVSDSPLTTTASEDAIMAVDRATGRTWVSQLALACSISAFSDDDGASWTPAAKACQTPPAVDHQTIAAGPFAPPLVGTVYPNAVYYCSQNVAYAACGLSLDGGLTYGQGVTAMYTAQQCFGLHGHVKVAPDGTVYVPNKACGAPECQIVTNAAGPNCHPGFAVSTDNGLTWAVKTIADGHFRLHDTGDPQLGIGAAGTMYFGYPDRDGHPKVAVCAPQGASCSPSVDVGSAFHIENTEMPTVVAGDDDRAAFAFLGSTTPGDDQQNNVSVTDANNNVVNTVSPWHNFTGTWHLYIAFTYDRGQHWTTTDATPDHPVQRGCIEFNAALCPSSRGSDDQRNLLDFNDTTIDREGRVLAAYTDGCQPDLGPPKNHGTCLADATRLSGLAPEVEGPAVARQTCGLGLYAKYDGIAMPSCGTSATTAGAPALANVNTSATPPAGRVAALLLVLAAILVAALTLLHPRRRAI